MRKFWLPVLMALLALGAFARGQKDAPVILESDGPQYVSPNHDGIKDTAVLGFTVKIKLRSLAGYIPKYGIQVIDKDGNVVNEIEGKEQRDISGIEAIGRDYEFFEMRREIMWDLRGTDGELVPDGEYVVRVWVEDANRNRSELDIEKFIVDTVAPTVELAFKDGADSLWFSPKGQRKTAEILVNGAEEALWVLQIVDEEDEPVVTKRLSDSALEEFVWDGCDDNGNFVADGNYAFKVMGEDYAGNKSEPALLAGIRVDNRPTAVTASAEFDGFSPNGDGKRDTLDVKLDYKLSTDFVSWSWRIEKTENPESTDAETAAGEGPQPTMKSGDVVEMDEEPAAVSEEAAADNNSDETAVDAPVAVSGGAEAEPLTDIEEAEEAVEEEPTAAESEEIVALEEETAEEASVAVEEEAIAGTETEAVSVEEFNAPADPEVLPLVITLNGKDENGNVLEDGWYRFVFSVEYKNGNKEEAFLPFLIDTVAPTVELKSVANPFVKVEPNSAKGEYFITLDAKDEGTLEGWDMEILDDKDSVLKMFAGEGDPSRLITWNGEVADVNEETGVYYIDFTVIDKGGNETIIRRPVVLDILLIERDGKYYLMVPNIIFGAYQFELDSYGEEQYQKNLESIDRVIDIYKRYPTYNLVLEGHALNIYDPQTQADENLEEEKILEPLTVNRAGEVQDALIERGFDFEKVIVHTFGGKNPIFSISDENENWKNRRVEFVMELKPIEELIKMVETETAAEAVDEETAETEAAAEEAVTAAEETESIEAETAAEAVADEETAETEAAAEETVTAAEETESVEAETAAEATDEEIAETETAAEAVADEETVETEAAVEETVTAAEETESAEAETAAEAVADEETAENETAAEETVTAAEETESVEAETAAEAVADEETAENETAEISVDEAAAIGDEVPAEPTDDGDLF